MCRIDLCDFLTFSPSKKLTVKCNVDLGISEKENIVYKAAVALNEFTNQNNTVEIEIEKNIPTGAGLGGGSSNAATTLLTLNELWGLDLDFEDLLKIGKNLGSDIAFFLYEKPAVIEFGRGDLIIPMEKRNTTFEFKNYYYLLVNPEVKISTKHAYSLFKKDFSPILGELENPESEEELWDIFDFVMRVLCTESIASGEDLFFANDFEDIVCKIHPILNELLEELLELSDHRAAMTGSGSSFYALFKTKKEAKEAEKIIKSKFNMDTFIGKLLNKQKL
jgi:4-diphosphocytidyl-2-C-methyl-D-erythritol kinase